MLVVPFHLLVGENEFIEIVLLLRPLFFFRQRLALVEHPRLGRLQVLLRGLRVERLSELVKLFKHIVHVAGGVILGD